MAKFSQLYDYLLTQFPAGTFAVHQPDLPPAHWLEMVHEPGYVLDYQYGTLDPRSQRRIGLPWSELLVQRTLRAVGGTILTARLALESGLACNTAGGTHHAFAGYGSGFCILNDGAIALRVLQAEGLIQRAVILDLDVHQGDGTARIFRHDPSVFTFSMHCEANFPLHKQIGDLDVPLPIGLEDEAYLRLVEDLIPGLLQTHRPDLVIYNAGVDPHRGDLLGKLALSDTGIFQRDQRVIQVCRTAGVPVACVIGGGYAQDLAALVQRHGLLFHAAVKLH
jgi:acetoin utilization deacetylase AcuC-like enzyme